MRQPLTRLLEPSEGPAGAEVADPRRVSAESRSYRSATLPELVTLHGEVEDLEAGQVLWREGDAGTEVAVVTDGALEVVVGQSDDDVVLRTLGPGAVLGEMACLDGQPRSATIRAAGASRVHRCTDELFLRLLRTRPDILEELLRQQIARVRSLTGAVSSAHRQAITDPLTGLYNLGFLMERLHMEIERARQTDDRVSVVMLDVDHFKRFNDTNGHPAGNVVLSRTAELLQKAVRRGDIVARYGGEEFAMLLYGASLEDGVRLAEEARRSVRACDFPGRESQPGGRVTVSIGVATYPDDAVDHPGLLEVADERLYQAKRGGRDRTEAGPRYRAIA